MLRILGTGTTPRSPVSKNNHPSRNLPNTYPQGLKNSIMDDSDFTVDPALAEAMGFTSFGAQSGSKRKFAKDDGYVDPEAKKRSQPPQGKGANAMPLGVREKQQSGVEGVVDADLGVEGFLGAGAASLPPRPVGLGEEGEGAGFAMSGSGHWDGEPDLQAWRKGVRNQRGDMVYFEPSFIEDPWKGLTAK